MVEDLVGIIKADGIFPEGPYCKKRKTTQLPFSTSLFSFFHSQSIYTDVSRYKSITGFIPSPLVRSTLMTGRTELSTLRMACCGLLQYEAC